MIIEAIGWIGSMLFCLCALPQLITVYRNKHGFGLSWGFLLLWLFGEILCAIYVGSQPIVQLPLIVNYALNLVMLLVIIYYKIAGAQIEASFSNVEHREAPRDCIVSSLPNDQTKDDN